MDRWSGRAWVAPVYDDRGMTQWGWIVQGRDRFVCGEYVDIGALTYINAQCGVTIEDDAEIGSHCAIYSRSTIDHKEGPVHIGRGAKIGAHSVIMPGITIGAGATVGACSFVNRDVPSGSTVFGTPARTSDPDGWIEAMALYYR